MERRKFVRNCLLFLSSLGLAACQHEYREEPFGRPVRRRGPPPFAPAHGYRHRYRRGLDLVFDTGLGVYLVVGARRTYFYQGRFYRFRGGEWETSRDYDETWRRSRARRLPRNLRRRAGRWTEDRRGRGRDRDRRRRGGPPPGAPRHGYRHRYRRGVDLVYDSGLGVYLVAGTRFYYYDGRFYRVRKGEWESRADHDGPWRRSSGRRLPARLRRKAGRWKKERDKRREDRERPRGRRREGY